MTRLLSSGSTVVAVALLCTLAVLAPTVALAPVGTATAASTTITECTTIDAPGTYVLGTDISNSSTTSCLSITSSDVVLDGAGYTVQGGSVSNSVGVEVDGGSQIENVTVRDVVVESWYDGIVVEGVADGRIEDVEAVASVDEGLQVADVRTFEVTGSRFVDSGDNGVVLSGTTNSLTDFSTIRINDTLIRRNADVGLYLIGISDARFHNLTVVENRDGVYATSQYNRFNRDTLTENVTLSGSEISRNDRDGIRFDGSGSYPAPDNTVSRSTLALNGRNGVNATANTHGLRLDGLVASSNDDDGVLVNDSDDVLVRNVTSRSNSFDGVEVNFGTNVTLTTVESRGNGDIGIEIDGVDGLTIEAVYAADNGFNGMMLDELSSRVRVRDGRFVRNDVDGAELWGTSDDRYTNLTARANSGDGFDVGSSLSFFSDDPVTARDLTAVSNGDDGIQVDQEGSTVEGATVRNNTDLEVVGPDDAPGVTFRDLETAVGTFDEVEIRDGGLLSPRLATYDGKAPLPAMLNVSGDTEYVDVTFSYDDGDLPDDADESTLALFNATDTVDLTVVNARIDTTLNTVAANVTGGSFDPLGDGGRIELVMLADTVPIPNVTVSTLRAPASVTGGDRLNVSATLENVGDAEGTVTPEYRVDGSVVATGSSVTLAAGESTTVAFNLTGSDTSGFPTGDVTHGVYTANDSATATLTVTAASAGGPGPLGPDLRAPTDPDGDGRYEDVTGDGSFNVLDVSVFLARFGAVPDGEIQYFDFNSDGGINILDVAALLEET